MTHPPEREATILRLYHAEKWPIGTIATQLGIHHSVVRRVLKQEGVAIASTVRVSSVDPFVPFIQETLAKFPRLRVSRLHEMLVARGYPGSADHLRRLVRTRYRPRQAPEAFLRLRTIPGEQAQVDWGIFGRVQIGKASRQLVAFVMVLSYSRRIYLRFFYGMGMANFLAGHVGAFERFQSVPRVVLYDNLKSAVTERVGDAIRFNPTLLELAGHYRFEPRPVAPFRGNEKGRVERAIQYTRHSFFAAREFTDLDDLNAQAAVWCEGIAAARPCPEDRSRSVAEVFEDERDKLLALPNVPFPTEERHAVRVGKTPYVRFDLNDYSVPHTQVKKALTVLASTSQVRVVDGLEVVATHPRSYDRGQQIEDPAHIQALVEVKAAARKHRGQDRLHFAAPSTKAFLHVVADRGGNMGATVNGLLKMLERHGAAELEAALTEAVQAGVGHLQAVHHVLDRRREARGLLPPVQVTLPDDPRVRNLVVTPHSLAGYDALHTPTEEAV